MQIGLPALMFVSVILPALSHASSCQISQSQCTSHPSYRGTFLDNYNNAASDQTACLQRATDYHNWCGNPDAVITTATYFINGVAQASRPQCFPWAGQTSLQSAVNSHVCVEVQNGNYGLAARVLIPPGNWLIGHGSSTSLHALPLTSFSQSADPVIAAWPPGGPTVFVSDLVIDGGNVATYVLGYSNLTGNRLTLTNARCAGVAISGSNLVIQNSSITYNGWPANVPGLGLVKCSDTPGGVELGAGIYGEAKGAYWAPQILNNTIAHNYGPALDNNGVWGGTFKGNTAFDNHGWAAVSLYGASYWTVANNTIYHASSETVGQMAYFHPSCTRGPAGAHSAAIFLCEDTISGNLLNNFNSILNNTASGFYGILSVGNATASVPYQVPRLNHFTSNNVGGSYVGCADDFKPGDWYSDVDTWDGVNTCQGLPATGPTYF